jgi:DNA-binding transcriptional LysR family regulator
VRIIVCAAPSYDWRFKSAGTRHSARITGRLWANALDVLAAAAIDGSGIVHAPLVASGGRHRARPARRILLDYETMPAPVNVLFERARRTSPSVPAFLDYLVESTKTGSLAGMSRFG